MTTENQYRTMFAHGHSEIADAIRISGESPRLVKLGR